MSEQKIAPGLLLAMPQLQDPNFQRSVVLMVQHDSEMSLGLILNRPSETTVTEILGAMGIPWRGDTDDLVWEGGPVMPETGWLLHTRSKNVPPGDGTLELLAGISLTTSPENLQFLAQQPPAHVRFLMGYAGWGAGQLSAELVEGAWLAIKATRELIFETEPDVMWESALASIGVDPGSLFPGQGVH
ncbi:MAG: YqgE/AlgH family protein [bacterium]|nr:YqgE/AlgH family protein [bacterium]